jgi:acetoin utilization deacetylase AcuC-like enzyme/GNAT superfamily N-acetyltransferase
MFRIRRVHDDVARRDAEAIGEVQAILRSQISWLSESAVMELSEKLRNPVTAKFRSLLLVAERGSATVGFALLMLAPDLRFAYLDLISTAKSQTGRGLGSLLYERVREESRLLGAEGLYFECLPDDPEAVSDPAELAGNQARLRFYESFGARPIINTAYETPVNPGDTDLPHLLLDDLGTGVLPSRQRARTIVRAILERKYASTCPPAYVDAVVTSFRDDPIKLRPFRYRRRRGQADETGSITPRLPPAGRVALVIAHGHIIHHVRERGYVEAPARIPAIERELDKLGQLVEKLPASRFPDKHLHAVHDREFLRYLKRTCESVPEHKSVYPFVFPIRNHTRPPTDLANRVGYYCVDTFTPLHRNVWPAARSAVDCALTCARLVREHGRQLAYALVRPPGHHAERRSFGGFCYLATAATAAQYLSETGKVAVLDVDYHHGNGQQDIFYDRGDVLTISIHGHPRFAYPYFSGFEDERGIGEGEGKNVNIPLPEQTDGKAYLKALRKALLIIQKFEPKYLVLCLGLDTALRDPTGTFSLRADDFEANGKLVGQLGLPTLVVQEGGYDTRTLGRNARHFIQGLWRGSFPRAG